MNMEVHDVALKLKKTDKGRLVYKCCRSLDTKSFNFPEVEPVFGLKSTDVVLENCEEASFAKLKIEEEEEKGDLFRESIYEEPETIQHDACQIIVVGNESNALLESVSVSVQNDKEERIDLKTKCYEKASIYMYKEAKQRSELSQRKLNQKYNLQQQQVMKYNRESEENAKMINNLSIEQRKSRDKMRRTKNEEAERRRQLRLEQGRERLRNAEPIVAECTKLHNDIVQQMEDMNNKNFSNNSDVCSILKNFRSVYQSALAIMKDCCNTSVMEPDQLTDLSNAYSALLQLYKNLITVLESLKIEERKRKVEEMQRLAISKAKEEERERILRAEREKEMSQKNPEFACPSLPKELLLSVSRSAHHQHQQLIALLLEYEGKSKRFTSNKSNLKLIMGINKAISLPVSSITSRAGSDIKSKLSDLNQILKGRNVKVANQPTDISRDDNAMNYAKLFMAKKFVKQAEGQVSSNHATAFSLALTLIGVWAEDEIFGKLVLGQLQSKCPFAVPFYVPQLPGQSEKEYNRSRGYIYGDDDQVEGQDKFLARMSGLIRSYAAVIQSPLPPGVREHPHGIAEGWKWLTRMLNLDPWPEVTATALLDFLEVAGHALMKKYGRQFEKLLYSLAHDYFPKIQEVSSGGGGGPLQRLQMFLKDCIKSKSVPKPDGFLDDDFWNTYHPTSVVGS